MKKLIRSVIVLFFLFFFENLTFAQGWMSLTNPLGMGENSMTGKVIFVSPTEGWITTRDGNFLHTIDGGTNWVVVDPSPNDTDFCFSDPSITMDWVGTTHGWNIVTIGNMDSAVGAAVYKTTNGGINWTRQVLSNEVGVLGIELQFTDVNHGWVLLFSFTGLPKFLRTTDGGTTWNEFNGAGIFYFIDNNVGWAYSGAGPTGTEPPHKIMKTIDGGNNWSEQFNDSTAGTYEAMFFTDANHGWIVGDLGKVLKTIDGGVNWTYVTNIFGGTSEKVRTVFFLDANNGWIPYKRNTGTSNEPIVYHTTDGGASWTIQSTPLGDNQGFNSIFSIYFWDLQTGWLSADWGRLAKYVGVTGVEKNTSPDNFSLEQNYPNPFNPGTKINYSIKENSFVTLKVFDVLGNEISILVNEEKPAGNYSIDFNAKSLSNGIYFYSITAGDFSSVKKMILLK